LIVLDAQKQVCLSAKNLVDDEDPAIITMYTIYPASAATLAVLLKILMYAHDQDDDDEVKDMINHSTLLFLQQSYLAKKK
jgi:hypothetical protein